jgi:hypothetical protein
MSRVISVNSMYCVIISVKDIKGLLINYIPLLFYNFDDVVTSCVKSKFSLTPFCKRRVVTVKMCGLLQVVSERLAPRPSEPLVS